MSTRDRVQAALAAIALAGITACGGSSASTPTSPAAPATSTDEFSGTLGQTGSDSHVFAVAANGTVQVTLTSVGPLTTMSLGIAVATSDGTSCLTSLAQTGDARTGSVALKGTAETGNYCVRVYDSGNIPISTEVTYTVQVTHP